MHRSLTNSLRSRLENQPDWFLQLPWVLLGLRNSPNCDTNLSPALLVYGQCLEIPGLMVLPTKEYQNVSCFAEDLSKAMERQHFTQNLWHGGETRKTFIPSRLSSCKYVLLRDDRRISKLRPRYQGPFQVISRGKRTFRIMMGNRETAVSLY